jgi:hypothetical protein
MRAQAGTVIEKIFFFWATSEQISGVCYEVWTLGRMYLHPDKLRCFGSA